MRYTGAELLSRRLESVQIRDVKDVRRAIVGKKPNEHSTMEIDGVLYNIRVTSVIPVERECCSPKCRKSFKPVRARDMYCCRKCNEQSKWLRRKGEQKNSN